MNQHTAGSARGGASTRGGGLGFLFVIAAAGGIAATVVATPGASDPWMYAPTALVAAYALAVHVGVSRCGDRAVAEHHIDTVYFLGFLFTLGALVVLFSRLAGIASAARGDGLVTVAMTYIGISVTTSLAGVLMRSVVRGAYLRTHPERSADSIEAFLAERSATVAALAGHEQAYMDALVRYVAATESFTSGLVSAREGLTEPVAKLAEVAERQVASATRFEQAQERLVETANAMQREAGAVPWSEVGREMESFRRGVAELNEVIDGLVHVLENRVELIR